MEYKNKDKFLAVWKRDRKFFTTAHLKYIAIFVMLLSHLSQSGFLYMLEDDYYNIATSFTLIGRLAMPIFCFFTVQAVLFTKDIKKYFTRMFLFALISEIPFDLAFKNTLFDWSHQNVIFTLLIGALVIHFIDLTLQSNKDKYLKLAYIFFTIIVGILLAEFLKTDYSAYGILAIILIYFTRNNKILLTLAIMIAFSFEFKMPGGFIDTTYGFVYLSIPLILLYNGKLGKQNKWLFYVFYPLHLFIIFLLKSMII